MVKDFTDSQSPGLWTTQMDPLEHLSSSRRFGFADVAVNVPRLAVEMSSVGKLATRSLNEWFCFDSSGGPGCGESRMILADSSICQNGRGITWFVDMLISGWCQATSPLFPSSKPWNPPKEAVHLTALQAREDHGELTWTFQKIHMTARKKG